MADYDRDAYMAKLQGMNQQELEDELIELMKNPATREVVRKYMERQGISIDGDTEES